MKGRIWTKLVLFFLLAAVVIALFVPEAVGRIYERQTLGEASYEQVSYEPYEIRYYDSFAEKLDAIAGCVFRGEEIYKLQIGERTDNVSDAELMQIVNEELQKIFCFPRRSVFTPSVREALWSFIRYRMQRLWRKQTGISFGISICGSWIVLRMMELFLFRLTVNFTKSMQ